jgi:hypothetical protein
MRRIFVVMMVVLILAPLVMTGCSRDDVAVVRIQLKNVPQGTAQNTNSIFERVFRWFVPNVYAVTPPPWVIPWNEIQVVISAPDLEDITFVIPPTETSVTLELPVGPNRRITAYGINSSSNFGRNWGGSVEINLNPGDEIDAVINMLPMTQVLADYWGGPSVSMQWSVVGSTYGVTGYNVYRAENPDGPYEKIQTIAGVSASSATDSDNLIIGITYYYKVSVITAASEGEKSNSMDVTIYMPF